MNSINWIAFQTILSKEMRRIVRIWVQTLLPPAITATLYFLIFGNLIGERLSDIFSVSYTAFIAPGLIMMAIISNAYAHVASSFFGAKFQQNIAELLISPTSNATILLGFSTGGLILGLAVGAITMIISLFFTDIHIHNVFVIIGMFILASMFFSLAGFFNGIFANKFDDVSIIPTFILTPLIYLGGIFYSIKQLPEFWQTLSYANPILYIINAFRYGFLGISDTSVGLSFLVLLLMTIALFLINLHLMRIGYRLKP